MCRFAKHNSVCWPVVKQISYTRDFLGETFLPIRIVRKFSSTGLKRRSVKDKRFRLKKNRLASIEIRVLNESFVPQSMSTNVKRMVEVTWKLLHCLYKHRLLRQRAMDGADDDDDLWLHSSEKEIIEKLYKQNADVREYQLIIDWLEQCEWQQHFDKCHHFMDETISWENTLHQLQNVGKTVFGSQRENRKEFGSRCAHS